MKIKILSFLLVFCFIFSTASVMVSAETAGEVFEIGVVNKEVVNVEVGEEFTVDFEIKKNTGVSFLWLDFEYDKEVFECVKVEKGEPFGAFGMAKIAGTGIPYYLLMLSSGYSTDTGKLISLTFKVKKAYCGETDIVIKLRQNQTANCAKYEGTSSNTHVPFVGAKATYTVHNFAGGAICPDCGFSNCPQGDLNGDMLVNVIDLVRIKKIIAGIAVSTGASADIDGNGAVNSIDVTSLRKIV